MSPEERRKRIKDLQEELVQLLEEEREYISPTLCKDSIIKECSILKRNNQFVDAVKLYRSKMGCGLIEAKNAVERI